ncbi:hypothetical protein ISS85_02580 [Candidatus Microgenomates bacterium]|nr:hypothetical protein [Candidatus Microgenomates bacterium]
MTTQKETDNLGGEEPVDEKPSRFERLMLEMARPGMTAGEAMKIVGNEISAELQNPQNQEGQNQEESEA